MSCHIVFGGLQKYHVDLIEQMSLEAIKQLSESFNRNCFEKIMLEVLSSSALRLYHNEVSNTIGIVEQVYAEEIGLCPKSEI